MKKAELIALCESKGIVVKSRDTIDQLQGKLAIWRLENPNQDFLRQMKKRLVRAARWAKKGRQAKASKIRESIQNAVKKHVGPSGYQLYLDNHIFTNTHNLEELQAA
jgi:hypothetical protein